MTEQDLIKREALDKLRELVIGFLRTISDLREYQLEVPEGYFSNEELSEVNNALKMAKDEVEKFCHYNGIEIDEHIINH